MREMMLYSRCSAPMKPLFTSFYCPKNCDRKTTASIQPLMSRLDETGWWRTSDLSCWPIGKKTDIDMRNTLKSVLFHAAYEHYDEYLFRVDEKHVVVEHGGMITEEMKNAARE